MSAPYLHPSQRNLKTEQVGPSAHLNDYHVGVLQGNWVEDRAAYGQRPVRCQLDRMTVARASYKLLPEEERQAAKAETADPRPMDRQQLFGHGHDFHQQDHATMCELMHSEGVHRNEPCLKADATYRLAGLRGKTAGLLDKKKTQWRDETDVDSDTYCTTNKATLYKTAERVTLDRPEAPVAPKRSLVSQSVLNDTQKAELRGHVALKRSPLLRRR
eukprot:TRINITY_DN18488_c0_g1_i1.p2 TRINITY_DN18488_c0_g1~~TRINITY_DN18488_c0_g1_i1.p2  ORF type:complete len:244 (+),score=81.86 TRINITY_DN18488_c0_g1_i1:86-733(+)